MCTLAYATNNLTAIRSFNSVNFLLVTVLHDKASMSRCQCGFIWVGYVLFYLNLVM